MHTQTAYQVEMGAHFFLFYSGKKSVYANTCSSMSSGLDDLGMGTSKLSTYISVPHWDAMGCTLTHAEAKFLWYALAFICPTEYTQ